MRASTLGRLLRWVARCDWQVITFGLYYFLYLRREFCKHKGVILTNMRMIQASQPSLARSVCRGSARIRNLRGIAPVSD